MPLAGDAEDFHSFFFSLSFFFFFRASATVKREHSACLIMNRNECNFCVRLEYITPLGIVYVMHIMEISNPLRPT